MANEIRDAFNTVYSDGPSGSPDSPPKPDVRGIVGQTIQDQFDGLKTQVETGLKPIYTLALATTGNVTLSGEQTIDGTLTSNTALLVRANTSAIQNGAYITAAGAWVRMSAFDTGTELLGQRFYIKGGSTLAGKTYGLQLTVAPTVGVDNLPFDVVDTTDVSIPDALDALRAVGANIASGSTVDLSTATGDTLVVTGSTPIDSFGTADAGVERTIIAQDGVVVNASANIITPDGTDITIPEGGSLTLKSIGSGVWQVTSFPGDVANEVTARKALIDAETSSSEVYGTILRGSDKGQVAGFGNQESTFTGVTVYRTADGAPAVAGVDKFLMPGFGEAPADAIEPSNIMTKLQPYFGPAIYGVEGEEQSINAVNIIADRSYAPLIGSVTLAGSKGHSRKGGQQIVFRPDKLGATANLFLWPANTDGAKFADLPLNVFSATLSSISGATTPVIANFGDSILYRGGSALIEYFLTALGKNPTWIGSLTGEDYVLDGVTLPGQLGEAKPGHCLGDMTYAFTTRVAPLAPGDEATYLAASTDTKRLSNTLLRASTGGDAPGDIRNGYVMDFEFWRTRWAVDYTTPTMLLIEYGRNDIRDVMESAVQQHFYDEDSLIYRRWFNDYPTSPVIRFLPNCGRNPEGDKEWTDSYLSAILGMWEAANDASGPVLLLPAWGQHPIDGCFDFIAPTETPNAITGAMIREIGDWVHPTGPSRVEFYRIVTHGVACAATATY